MCSTPFREALARIRNASCHRKRFQVVERIRNLLVHRAFAVLKLALDGEGVVALLGYAKMSMQRFFAMIVLPILTSRYDPQTTRGKTPGHIQGHQVGVFAAGHA